MAFDFFLNIFESNLFKFYFCQIYSKPDSFEKIKQYSSYAVNVESDVIQ